MSTDPEIKTAKQKHAENMRNWRRRNPEAAKLRRVKDRRLACYIECKEKYYSGWWNADRKMTRWSEVEDCIVLDRSKQDSEISKELGRSMMSIQVRRSRLLKEVQATQP